MSYGCVCASIVTLTSHHTAVRNFVLKQRVHVTKMKDFLSTGKNGWRNPDTKETIYKSTQSAMLNKLKVPGRSCIYKPRFPMMESCLKKELEIRRDRKAKVSSFWLRQRAKQLYRYIKNYKTALGKAFNASNRWLIHFMRRHKIKFRKRKNSKSKSLEENEIRS